MRQSGQELAMTLKQCILQFMQATNDRRRRRTSRCSLVLGLVAISLGACGGEEGSDGEGGPEEQASIAPGSSTAPGIPEDTPLGRAVAAHRATLEGSFWRGRIEGVLEGWRGSRQPMTDLLRETYRSRQYQPVFLDGLWPSPSAAVLVKAVREVPSHGLPASPYRPKVVIPLHAALALDAASGEGTLSKTTGDLERLAELEWQMPRSVYKTPRRSEKVPEVSYRPLKSLPEPPPLEPSTRCLLEAVHAATRPGGPQTVAQVAARCHIDEHEAETGLAAVADVIAQRQEHAASLALLDALLLQDFYQWMIDFTIDRRVHPFRSFGPVNRSRLPEERRESLMKTLAHVDDAEAFSRHLLSKVPQVPEYELTRAALARYVNLMDTKQPAELRVTRMLKRGDEGDAVAALQRRLADEGYYEGRDSGTFDDATHDAVVRYQRAHGLADGGVVGAETVESLNIPFEWRVKQLLVALGRWRETPITRRGEPDLYVLVNLPALELEVVEHGKTIRRHKVIVGSNRPEPDPLNDGVVWHQHRTKLFHTVISEVVLNPNWIVPEAIRIDEIEPKIRENPGYLEENNFTKVDALLVQGPGETNPLGVVKFSLESTDAIYLHDTDKRWLFKEADRALSHGCIRVDDPVELANFVLKRQNVSSERIAKRIEEHTTLPIKLEDPIPIFVEYRTVGFDDDGEPLFYDDIYQYDVAYWKKRTPITRRFP